MAITYLAFQVLRLIWSDFGRDFSMLHWNWGIYNSTKWQNLNDMGRKTCGICKFFNYNLNTNMLNIQLAVSRAYSKLSSKRLAETPRNTSVRFVINPIKYKYIVGLKWSFLPTNNSAACTSIYMFGINENRGCSAVETQLSRKSFRQV